MRFVGYLHPWIRRSYVNFVKGYTRIYGVSYSSVADLLDILRRKEISCRLFSDIDGVCDTKEYCFDSPWIVEMYVGIVRSTDEQENICGGSYRFEFHVTRDRSFERDSNLPFYKRCHLPWNGFKFSKD